MTTIERVLELVTREPGLTERQIAKKLLGDNAVQGQVNPSCRRLVRQGKIRRIGLGTSGQPYTYEPA